MKVFVKTIESRDPMYFEEFVPLTWDNYKNYLYNGLHHYSTLFERLSHLMVISSHQFVRSSNHPASLLARDVLTSLLYVSLCNTDTDRFQDTLDSCNNKEAISLNDDECR